MLLHIYRIRGAILDTSLARITFINLLMMLGASRTVAQTAPSSAPAADGSIISTKPGEAVDASHDDYVRYLQREYEDDVKSAAELGVTLPSIDQMRAGWPTASEYQHRLHDPRFECDRLLYRSDGLKVVGYLFKPVNPPRDQRLPAIIFNRGGNADVAQVGTITLLEIYPFLEAGFVVLAPQYRGSDGGEGHDEYGGADVHDVLNVITLARSLDYVDPDNLFMYGESRGGMETYLAIKQHAPINAAAVLGASANEVEENHRRPLTDVYEKAVPNFDRDPGAAFRARSAALWAEAIDKPILILHGGADWRVAPGQALEMATRLEQLHKPYQLFIYAGDDHHLTLHHTERDRQVLDWFRRFMKPASK
ncbi:MAG TPA: prolyl oligopeptidase family serine peptidase [Tepidisphaeraceae bacterium]|nr:prolyl oligopeptidase family serine peptidase [Tepidisphaeraceae bacterium]